MSSTTAREGDLLAASLGGALPASTQAEFDRLRRAGNASLQAGDYDGALAHYTAAEAVNPLSPVPPANRALVHLRRGDWEAVRAEAAMALELQRALPPPARSAALTVKLLLRRATACARLMLVALAAEDYAAVLRLEPANAAARAELDRLRAEYKLATAAATATAAASSDPLLAAAPGAARENGRPDAHERRKRGPAPLRIRVMEDGAPTQQSCERAGTPAVTTGAATRAPRMQQQQQQQPVRRHGLQDESELVSLKPNIVSALSARWTSVAPSDASEFARAWGALRTAAPAARADYLVRMVGAARVAGGVLGADVTPQLLVAMLAALADGAFGEGMGFESGDVAQLVEALTRIARFDLLMMFFSAEERQVVQRLLHQLNHSGVDAATVDDLRNRFK